MQEKADPLGSRSYSPPSRYVEFLAIKESFNDWGGRGCRKFVPVLGGDGAKTAPPGDIFDQPPGKLSSIWGKLTDHVEDHAVLSAEEVVSVTTPGTESTYPHPPQSLNDSKLLAPWRSLTYISPRSSHSLVPSPLEPAWLRGGNDPP